MNGKKVLHRFELDDDRLHDQEAHTVAELYGDAIVDDRKYLFSLEWDAALSEFVRETPTIRPLEQPWPEFGMNVIGGAQNDVRYVLVNQMNSVRSVRVCVLRGSAL